MVARADDSLSCSGPGGGGRRNERVVVQGQNEEEEPSTILTTTDGDDQPPQPNGIVDSQAWPTAEGYTPLGDVFGMGSILVSMPPSSMDEDDDDDPDGDGGMTTYFSAGPNAFIADPSALFGNLNHENDNNDENVGNDDQDHAANEPESDAVDAFGEEDFRDVASSALMALENDYEMTIRGQVRPSLMDGQPPLSSSGPAMPLFISSSFDHNNTSKETTDDNEIVSTDFADFGSPTAAASIPMNSQNQNAAVENQMDSDGPKETNIATTTAAVSPIKKELPSIDTVAVKKAVNGIISSTALAEKLQQWQQEKDQKRHDKNKRQCQHNIIPPTPLKAFARQTPKAIQATANLTRAATIADALVRLSPSLLEAGKEHHSIHIVGADHVECSSPERIVQLFGPLVRWLGSSSSSCPRHVSLALVGPNVPSSVTSTVNLLEPGASTASQQLLSAEASCYTANYHEWLAERLQNNNEPKSQQHGFPDLVVCYNAGIWGYNEWKPTIRYLVQLESPINFVVTSYTIEEAEDDFDVIEQVVEEESKQSNAAAKSCRTLWGPEANPFASKKKRETASAVQGRDYRENAAWQAWRFHQTALETTTNESAWDELCVNPQKGALESGRNEGRKAGLAAGYRDGRSVGIVKGVEFGMEIGFMRGVLKEVLNAISSKQLVFDDASQYERIQKTTSALAAMLEDFPSPDQVFRDKDNLELTAAMAEAASIDQDSEFESSSNSPDLTRRMQSIRSKFTLLRVQLKWNNFSLKNVMDIAKVDAGETSNLASQTTDW